MDLPDPGIELESPALQEGFLSTELSGKRLKNIQTLKKEEKKKHEIRESSEKTTKNKYLGELVAMISFPTSACDLIEYYHFLFLSLLFHQTCCTPRV